MGQTASTAPKHTEEPTEAVDLIPRYLLQDPRGRVVTQESFRGRFQLIAFGFISCPDVCPTTLLGFRNIIVALGGKAGGLRGSPELLQRAAESFRVRYEKVREPGAAAGIYTMDHSTGMYLLDSEGRFLVKFASTAPAPDVAARIGALMDADHSPPPVRRGNAPLR
jgi:protein SCO1/2